MYVMWPTRTTYILIKKAKKPHMRWGRPLEVSGGKAANKNEKKYLQQTTHLFKYV